MVLLLDELDKAEPDLPNGLLQTMGDLRFTVPYINKVITGDAQRLLIIITTNEERELPPALVRRCMSHTLKMAKDGDDRLDWLIKRGKLHFGDDIDKQVYKKAAELLWQDRQEEERNRPGLAEYLDLLRVLTSIDRSEQHNRLTEISGFAYNKGKEQP